MRRIRPKRGGKRREEGYILVMIMFFLALLMLSMAVAAPTTVNAIQRDREEEMVWRGKQYVRGIRLYYVKMHRFPVELDDLAKPKTLGVRFMRKAYKDPMNQVDGSWRLIYLGPGGTLIGSLKRKCVNAVLTGQGNAGIANSAIGGGSSFGGGSNTFSSGFGGSSLSSASNSSSSPSGSSGATSTGSTGAACGGQASTNSSDPNASQGSSDALGQPHDVASTDLPQPILGGNIIGVGSKVDKQSFLWYEKARNYRLFEFVWDPTIDVITGQRPGQIPGAVTPGTVNPVGTPAGTNPSSTGPGQTPNAPVGPNGPEIPPLQAPTNP